MSQFSFRTTEDFNVIAKRLSKHCGISRELSSKRLHQIKTCHGLGGADNVIFDFSGGVYHRITTELLGSLTIGGKKEKA